MNAAKGGHSKQQALPRAATRIQNVSRLAAPARRLFLGWSRVPGSSWTRAAHSTPPHQDAATLYMLGVLSQISTPSLVEPICPMLLTAELCSKHYGERSSSSGGGSNGYSNSSGSGGGYGNSSGGIVQIDEWRGAGGMQHGRPQVLAEGLDWGQRVTLPWDWSLAITAAAAAGARGTAQDNRVIGEGTAGDAVVLTVWLSTAHGPAAARLTAAALQQLCSGGGGSPVAIAAQLWQRGNVLQAEGAPQVELQCCMHSRNVTETVPVEEQPSPAQAHTKIDVLLSAELQEPQKRLSDAVQGRMLSVAGVAVVLLVAWLQLLIPTKAQVFQLVIVLVLSICCLVAFVILAFIKLPPAAPPPIPTTPTQLAPARLHRQLTYLQWSLTLEGSRLVDSKSGGE